MRPQYHLTPEGLNNGALDDQGIGEMKMTQKCRRIRGSGSRSIVSTLLALMTLFACAVLQTRAQTITADYSVTGNAYSPVYKTASTIQLSNGPLDNQLMKNVGVKLERTFWGPMTWEQTEGTYNWYAQNPCTSCGPQNRDWGDDLVLDDIIARGTTPVITLSGYPTWDATDGTGILTGPPPNYSEYETLVEDGLNHLRSKHPNIQYIRSFSTHS
jgi:hypothetical protein